MPALSTLKRVATCELNYQNFGLKRKCTASNVFKWLAYTFYEILVKKINMLLVWSCDHIWETQHWFLKELKIISFFHPLAHKYVWFTEFWQYIETILEDL